MLRRLLQFRVGVMSPPGEAPSDSHQPEIMEAAVASVCDVCGKGPGFGNNVSHSHVRTRRRWNPNIQTVRAIVSGTPKRLNVCTSCIKAGKVTRSAAS
jgi:large subunit ribosomal protein L28